MQRPQLHGQRRWFVDAGDKCVCRGLRPRDDGDGREVGAELVQRVRERVGPVASFRIVKLVPRLPKTRSGKILRGTMRRLAEGKEGRPPPTIEDPTTLDDIAQALRELGYPSGLGPRGDGRSSAGVVPDER